jgi:hypothetical protein
MDFFLKFAPAFSSSYYLQKTIKPYNSDMNNSQTPKSPAFALLSLRYTHFFESQSPHVFLFDAVI